MSKRSLVEMGRRQTKRHRIAEMKRKLIMLVAAIGLYSCTQSNQSTATNDALQSSDSVREVSRSAQQNNFHTAYHYTDSSGARLTIQNSFPKSGIQYTTPEGRNYVYAVFWTQVTNETAKPFELAIDFPLKPFEFPSSSGNNFRVLLPPDTVTPQKVPLFDYGLAVKSFLDQSINQPSSLRRTIHPKDSSGFYVVTLSDHGVNSTLRTGLSIKRRDLFYRINTKDIRCGKLNQKMVLQQ